MQVILLTCKGIMLFSKEKHTKIIRNFIFWEGDKNQKAVLVVGNGEYYFVHEVENPACVDLLQHWKIQKRDDVPKKKPDGVGYCLYGEIQKWHCEKLGVSTPQNVRPIIKEVLGLN